MHAQQRIPFGPRAMLIIPKVGWLYCHHQRRVCELRLALGEAHAVHTQLGRVDGGRNDLAAGTHTEAITRTLPSRRTISPLAPAALTRHLCGESVVSHRYAALASQSLLAEGGPVLDLVDEGLGVLHTETHS